MITRIPLERTFDNPFQTRQAYAGIEELAASIKELKATRPETSGLLQVATGRIIIPNGQGWKILNPAEYGGVQQALNDEPDAFVQIAFAHRRLRAFHLLSQTDADYCTFPIEILVLDDKKMADLAWEENAKRKDLTPIEEAEALQSAMAIFGYTQEQIGQRWNLSQSAVANKIRLLKLPDAAQQAIRAGHLSERHGRALLSAAAKSPAIYGRAIDAILPPPPVSEDATEIARTLIQKYHFWETNSREPGATCSACNTPVPTTRYTHSGDFNLCKNCFRTGSYWSPPSAGETEKLIYRLVDQYSTELTGRDFPLDTEIALSEGVRSATCTTCPSRDGETCHDKECYELKKKAWRDHQVAQLAARLQKDFNTPADQVRVNFGWGGHTLNKHSADPKLIAPDGPCAGCKRLQFQYTNHISTSEIQPYKDLPFVYQCDHSGAHAAAQRRYEEAHKPAEQKTEAAQAAERLKSHKDQVRAILAQAEASFTRALANNHDGAWRAIAETLGCTPKPADDTEALMCQITTKVFSEQRDSLSNKWTSWDDPNQVTRFRQRVSERLGKYDIATLPALVDIITKLEKIWDFTYNNRIAGTITGEQIEGNHRNLEKLVDQVLQAGQPPTADLNRLTTLVQECSDELWEAAGDIEYPLPQDWGIHLEMSLSQLKGETRK